MSFREEKGASRGDGEPENMHRLSSRWPSDGVALGSGIGSSAISRMNYGQGSREHDVR